METPETIDHFRLIAAGIHLLPTLAWVILASMYWRAHGTARPQGQLLRLFRILSTIVALHYGLYVMVNLTTPAPGQPGTWLWQIGSVLTKVTTVAELAVLRHMLPLVALGAVPPSRLWLAVNYGFALLAGVQAALLEYQTGTSGPIVHTYLLVMTAAIVWQMVRMSRGGSEPWRPVIMVDLGTRNCILLGLGMFTGVALIVLVEANRGGPNLAWAAIHSAVGLALAGIFAVRILGEVIRRMATAVATILTTVTLYAGTRLAVGALEDHPLRWLVEASGVLALALAFGPGFGWLKAGVDRLMLRQSRQWRQQLHAFLQTLQPEIGVDACLKRTVAEVSEVLRLRGAGILARTEEALTVVVHGQIDLEPVARVWPRDPSALPEGAFDLLWLDDLELQIALHDAGVTWVVPIISPRTCWGYLFVSAGPLGIAAGGAKLHTVELLTRQLALVLDSADLLARAVRVERDLAQAEKLAAVGEMAARMAHEIRNPVTAARSLAQMLAREPESPLNADHAGIITRELDRVERQVRALLEFARRETYRFEYVRLDALVRAVVDDLRPRLNDLDLELVVSLDASAEDVAVRADAERLRQVVINLAENAVDALRGRPEPRRLTIALSADAAQARLVVHDTGPGVEPDQLTRLFDPFVSHKTQGTGLGLAIARRIIEAHSGKIEASLAVGGGMAFTLELPIASHEAPDLSAEALRQAV
ncbi:MAG: ATP-binding protein [Acidobacteriota bacterium]